MVLPEACSIEQKTAGVHEIAGPPLVGGVHYLNRRTALFRDCVRTILDTQQRFEGYLEFRDQACKIAATQLASMIKSPTDLLLAAKDDEELFAPIYATCMAFRDQKTFLGDKGDGSLAANIPNRYKDDVKLFKNMVFGRLNHVRSYFAYRKGLLKLDFVKWDSDPEEVLKRLKTSTRWSELDNHVLRRGLVSHMHLLKELGMSEVSLSELEKIALEKINSELSSELEVYVGRYDSMLTDHYFKRMGYVNLSRACSTQAQMTGIVFLEEALPIRAFSKEMLSTTPNIWRSPYVNQTVKQAFEDSMGSLRRVNQRFRTRVADWKTIPVLITAALFSTLATRRGA